MDYRIVEKPSFSVVGKALRVSTTDGEHIQKIPQFWSESMQGGLGRQLAALTAKAVVLPGVNLGICTDFSPNHQEFTYMIAAENADGTEFEGMIPITIPASTWAVFESRGALPEAIQSVWQRIYSEFLSSTQYQHAPGPDLEVYPSGDPRQPDYRCEVWISVTPR